MTDIPNHVNCMNVWHLMPVLSEKQKEKKFGRERKGSRVRVVLTKVEYDRAATYGDSTRQAKVNDLATNSDSPQPRLCRARRRAEGRYLVLALIMRYRTSWAKSEAN
jgi:hypothetical protein